MLVDANLLLFAVDERSPRQEAAARWLSEQLAGAARIGLPWESLGAFLRLSTHPRIFERPLTPETATGLVREWLASEVVWTPLPTARHGEVLSPWSRRIASRGTSSPTRGSLPWPSSMA